MKGLRKKGQRKRDPIPPIETPGGPRPEDNEIHRSLARYNRTGNALALWAAFRVCLEHDRPLPDVIKPFFWKVSNTLLEYSDRAEHQARDLIPDLVLETRNEGGGPSVFKRYATDLKNQELYQQTHSAMMKCIVKTFEPLSQAQVFENLADEANLQVEKVRKNFKAHERGLGSFAISAVQRAKKRGGVTEV